MENLITESERIIGHYRGAEAGPLVVAIGGIHGNEPAGVQTFYRCGYEPDLAPARARQPGLPPARRRRTVRTHHRRGDRRGGLSAQRNHPPGLAYHYRRRRHLCRNGRRQPQPFAGRRNGRARYQRTPDRATGYDPSLFPRRAFWGAQSSRPLVRGRPAR